MAGSGKAEDIRCGQVGADHLGHVIPPGAMRREVKAPPVTLCQIRWGGEMRVRVSYYRSYLPANWVRKPCQVAWGRVHLHKEELVERLRFREVLFCLWPHQRYFCC